MLSASCPKVVLGANAVNTPANASQGNRNQQQRIAYALVPGDPSNDEAVIAGRISLYEILTYALFDSGSTHSFKIGRAHV